MKIEIAKVGYLRENCYVLKKDGCVLVIDPGDEYPKIKELIGEDKVVGVFVTHAHPDHVGALEFFPKELIYDKKNLKEGKMTLMPFSLEVIATPGHKADSLSFYFPEENVLFTGDFLFKGSVGRMDLPTGNVQEMKESIKKMEKYDSDITIYPGHGPSSSLKEELENAKKMLGLEE